MQNSLHRTGGWLDGLRYATLDDEWQARRTGRTDAAGPERRRLAGAHGPADDPARDPGRRRRDVRHPRRPEVGDWLPIRPPTVRRGGSVPRAGQARKTLALELDGRLSATCTSGGGRLGADRGRATRRRASRPRSAGWSHLSTAAGATRPRPAKELLRICFEDLGLRRAIALWFADNGASWRIMEKLGMRREEHTVRDSLHRTRGWLDGVTYALLANEWRAQREPSDLMPQDLSSVSWPVRTERLSIRPCRPDDLDATWRFRGQPGVGEWLTQAHDDRAEYEQRFRDPERMAKVLVVEREGEVVGDQMIVIHDARGQVEVVERAQGVQAEIGWIIDPEHAGQGYATEAAAGLLRICFEDLGLRRVLAISFADNAPSWRLHGAARHAPRAVRRPRLPAPVARLARLGHLRAARRRVARPVSRRPVGRWPAAETSAPTAARAGGAIGTGRDQVRSSHPAHGSDGLAMLWPTVALVLIGRPGVSPRGTGSAGATGGGLSTLRRPRRRLVSRWRAPGARDGHLAQRRQSVEALRDAGCGVRWWSARRRRRAGCGTVATSGTGATARRSSTAGPSTAAETRPTGPGKRARGHREFPWPSAQFPG